MLKFRQKIEFVSTPWKIKIPLGNSVGDHMCYTNPFEWVMISFLHQRIIFLTIWGKNLTVAGVLRINIWFSLPVPKIKFDPFQQRKNALVFIFQVLH